MAFPTIPTAGANTLLFTETAAAGTTHTFPSLTTLDNASGDLLIAVIVLYQASATGNAFGTWGGGFTEFGDSSSATNPSIAMGAAYKISNGTETGTFTVVSTISGRAALCLMSVKNWHGTTVPEVAFSAATTTTAQDPPNLDPAGWAAEDTLWIAVGGGGETSLTGTWTGLASAPASYTNFAKGAIAGGDVIGACQIAVAFRGVNATAENPGAFTTDTTPEIERAATIAVRPAIPPATLPLQPSAAVATTALVLHAATHLPTQASAAASSAALALHADTHLSLSAATAVSSTALVLTVPSGTPATLPLQPSAAVSTAALEVHAPTHLPTAGAGALVTTSLALHAATHLPLQASAAVSTSALELHAKTHLPLGAAAATSTTSLVLTVPGIVHLPLGPSAASSTAALSLRATTHLPLGPATAASATGLTLRTPTHLQLGAASATANATLVLSILTAGFLILGSATATSTAALVLHAPPTNWDPDNDANWPGGGDGNWTPNGDLGWVPNTDQDWLVTTEGNW